MRQNFPDCKRQNVIIRTLLISFFIVSSLSLNAQTQTNFSGKWEFDKTNSDKDERGDASFNGTIILEIKHNFDTITFTNTFFLPGRDGRTLRPDKFLVNEQVTQDNSGSDPAKKFITWSQDRKVLTTNYIMTASIDGVSQDFLTTKTYKISEDGEILAVVEFNKSKLNGEKTVKKAYKKK
jgi:hypothetical protein